MKSWFIYVLFILVPLTALAGTASDELAAARAQIMPLFESMEAAANAHDSEKHVSFYAHEANLLFVMNDQAIIGWDALLKQQRMWWHDGKSDAHYTLAGKPDFRLFAPGLVMQTYFLESTRSMPDGGVSKARFGISAVWKKRPEGWRIIYAHESMVRQ